MKSMLAQQVRTRRTAAFRLEPMEARLLLSGYTLSQIGLFGTNASGTFPSSTLVADPSGNFFGTTPAGGVSGYGTVFEIAKGSGTLTTLASFNGTDGVSPTAVTLDASGNLYGTTESGSLGDHYGTAFEIARGSNAITTLASFNATNGAHSYSGVTLDASGNLYGTTPGNGVDDLGTVFEIAKGSGRVTTLATFNGRNGYQPAAVVLDASGNLYGTTSHGGPTYNGGDSGDGTVFEIAKASGRITTLVSFDGTNGAFPNGVVLDASGNLYGATGLAGGGYGTVFEISKGSGTITTLAIFQTPDFRYGVMALDTSGNLYGTSWESYSNSDQGTVFEVAKGSGTITTLASFNGADGANPDAGVTIDASGNLYGTTRYGGENGDGTVFEVAKGSGTITTLASFDGVDGENPQAGVTVDSSGNLYGTTTAGGENGAGTVFEIARGSGSIKTLVSFDGTVNGTSAGVTLDSSGNLYGITQQGGTYNVGTLFEIAKGSGTITTLVSFDGTDASPNPRVTLDAAGNLYGTTSYSFLEGDVIHVHKTVFEVAKGSGVITTLASSDGRNGAVGAVPSEVVPDASGNLYGVSTGGTSNDGTVVEIAKGSGTITVLASFDGTNGADPQAGVTLDAAGNLYGTAYAGAGSSYGTVFEFAKASDTITTLASIDGTNGLYLQTGVTVDPSGNIYGTTYYYSFERGVSYPDGAVFEIAKGSGAVTTLVSFDGTEAYPNPRVTLDASGNLYGTTSGGLDGYGTVFELAPNTAIVLRFTGGSNPASTSQTLTFTATVSGGVPDGETVTIIDASNHNAVVATGTLRNGSAIFTLPARTLSAGTHTLIAVYGGAPDFGASESQPLTLTILPAFFRPQKGP